MKVEKIINGENYYQVYWKGIKLNYLISETGKVYSIKCKKVIRSFVDISGYIRYIVMVPNGEKNKPRGIFQHTLLMHTFRPLPQGFVYSRETTINHIDGVKSNNNLNNLEYITFSNNIFHKFDIALQKETRGPIDYNIYLFRNDDGTEFIGTVRELYHKYKEQYGLFHQGLNQMSRGYNITTGKKCSVHRGWRKVETVKEHIPGTPTNNPVYKKLFNEQ